MSSGIFRISFNTVPVSLTRSCSCSSSAAKVAVADIKKTTKHTVNFFMITLESISPDARMTGIPRKGHQDRQRPDVPNGGLLQTELQLTKTLPQATTELVNSRMVGKTAP